MKLQSLNFTGTPFVISYAPLFSLDKVKRAKRTKKMVRATWGAPLYPTFENSQYG